MKYQHSVSNLCELSGPYIKMNDSHDSADLQPLKNIFIMRILTVLFLAMLCSNSSYSQEITNLKYDSEVVFIKDNCLKELISNIIIKKENCDTKGLYWYIQIQTNGVLIISKIDIANLIVSIGSKNILTTFLDDTILFIVNDEKIPVTHSGFYINLSSYIGHSNYSAIHYSYWGLQIQENNEYKVIKEKLYNCN
ncbi:hypothetical protein [Flavobacterium ardleyense]|uniref:hypothetical protein n=1 Tax=Flavobacterium ardleyense TaxID=2038737 RepID=UPI00298BF214|nr:hypothetical protein [Flavobacterium ardleyense]